MRATRLELVRYLYRGILSPLRLPVPPRPPCLQLDAAAAFPQSPSASNPDSLRTPCQPDLAFAVIGVEPWRLEPPEPISAEPRSSLPGYKAPMRFNAPLPIDAVLPELLARLGEHGAAVLRAPTGAGKTTRVPPALADSGRVLLLEPRRVAARAAARRMAFEHGSPLGEVFGYHVRFDRKAGPRTRVLAVTPGVLLRLLHDDPYLESASLRAGPFAASKAAWDQSQDERRRPGVCRPVKAPRASRRHGQVPVSAPGLLKGARERPASLKQVAAGSSRSQQPK